MKRIRCNSYEAQLTDTERTQLHDLLLQPSLSLAQVQTQIPSWRTGPLAGSKPSVVTLSNISRRLHAERRLIDMETAGKILVTTARISTQIPQASFTPGHVASHICNFLARDLLERMLTNESQKDRSAIIGLLLHREELA